MSNSHLLHMISLVVVTAACMLLTHLPTDHAYDPAGDHQQRYRICSSPIRCANIQKMSYPFWGSTRPDYCGHPAFHLKSCGGEFAEITIMSRTYRVLEINQLRRTLVVALARYNICPADLANSTFDATHFDYAVDTETTWIYLYYDCPRSGHDPSWGIFYGFYCYSSQTGLGSDDYLGRQKGNNYLAFPNFYYYYPPPMCKEGEPEWDYHDASNDEVIERLNSGSKLEWKANDKLCDDCQVSGGVCGCDSSSGNFSCHCKDKSYPISCGSDRDSQGPYEYDEHYLNCLGSGFQCKNLKNVSFPFWDGNKPEYCGHPNFKLNCGDPLNVAEITIMSKKYRVLEIDQTAQALRVDVEDFYEAYVCPAYPARNLNFKGSSFLVHPSYNQDLTIFYNCRISNFSASTELNSSYHCNTQDVFNFMVTDSLRLYNQTTTGIPLDDVIRRCSGSAVTRVSTYPYNFFPTRDYFYMYDYFYKYEFFPHAFEWYRTGFWDLKRFRISGFWLTWELPNHMSSSGCDDCQLSGGVCGYNPSSRDLSCYCKDGPYPRTCSSSSAGSSVKHNHNTIGSSSKRTWAIVSAAVLSGILVIAILIMYGNKRELISSGLVFLKKDEGGDGFNVEAFIESHGPLVPQRYNYRNVKKMTNSFAERVGKGGFGSVYKGKLPDGSLVAVKVLKESKRNGEEFINEVASIGRTSHVNIVTLVGFCYERTKRALIYEYMPNGSLDKFIFNQESMNKNIRLEWRMLYEIAIGIARGLEYLHRGCATRILHFDIKPHNILLDKDFCPKISDFGLAKLCQREDSVVSMLGARGTAGYVAPEVYCRSFGGVSYKSDVYSYGMMVLEMVGGRKNIDAGVSRTSKIYFPDWLYNHINDYGENMEISEEMTNEDEEMARKMILVSLWCIQTIPSDRPSMTRVVEMLEGSLQSLQIPPKPSLSFSTA